MARCAFHPNVETNLRCAECERYICGKDMVTTPVGYKCRECARPARGQLVHVKPRQWAGALAAAVVAGGIGGFLLAEVLAVVGWSFFFVMLLYGAAVGEAVRRGSGGHRGSGIALVAAAGVLLGTLVGGFSLFQAAFALLGAVGSSSRA